MRELKFRSLVNRTLLFDSYLLLFQCQVDGKLIIAAAQELWVHQAARLLK